MEFSGNKEVKTKLVLIQKYKDSLCDLYKEKDPNKEKENIANNKRIIERFANQYNIKNIN